MFWIWNGISPGPARLPQKKPLPVTIRGEIIQIGAVRVTQEGRVADEFQIMVRPKVYRHLNRRVSKLTGIKEARLREEGIPFPEAMERFHSWCGEDIIFLTWGFDDIGILRENLRLYDLDESWTDRWYNAQMIFNAQTDGSTSQKALKTAMELCGIEASRPAHDALGDAYHTALICAKLDLERGVREYDAASRAMKTASMGRSFPAAFSGRSSGTCRIRPRPWPPCPEKTISARSAGGRCWAPAGLPRRATGIWIWPPARSMENF